LETDSETTLLRKSQHENIPHHHFEIKGKLSPIEADEPKNY